MRTHAEIMQQLTAARYRLVDYMRRQIGDYRPEGVRQLGWFYRVVADAAGWSVTGSFGFTHFVAVSAPVDPYWHAHVASTRHYREFCAWLVPRPEGIAPAGDGEFFLDHHPLAVDTVPEQEILAAYERTRAAVHSRLGDDGLLDEWWPETGGAVRAYACTGRAMI